MKQNFENQEIFHLWAKFHWDTLTKPILSYPLKKFVLLDLPQTFLALKILVLQKKNYKMKIVGHQKALNVFFECIE